MIFIIFPMPSNVFSASIFMFFYNFHLSLSWQMVLSGKPLHNIPAESTGSAANHIDKNVNSKCLGSFNFHFLLSSRWVYSWKSSHCTFLDTGVERHPLRSYLDYVGYLYQRMEPLSEQERIEVSFLCLFNQDRSPLPPSVFLVLTHSFSYASLVIGIFYRLHCKWVFFVCILFSFMNFSILFRV